MRREVDDVRRVNNIIVNSSAKANVCIQFQHLFYPQNSSSLFNILITSCLDSTKIQQGNIYHSAHFLKGYLYFPLQKLQLQQLLQQLLMEGEDKPNNYSQSKALEGFCESELSKTQSKEQEYDSYQLQAMVLGEDLPKVEGQNKACKQSEQRIKFRGQYVPIAQIIDKQVKDIYKNKKTQTSYSVSAFELFKAVYENKVTAVHLTKMSIPQFEKFLKWIHPSHITQPNLQNQYLLITKSLKLAIGSTIQFQLQPKKTSSVLSDFCQFSKLFLSLSDITVVIKLGKWTQVQGWRASLQKLWQSLTKMKNVKIEIKEQWDMIDSFVASFMRSVLFGALACLTEISHLSFYQICFTSIGPNDSIAIQQSLRTLFQNKKITSLHLEQCTEFPIFPKFKLSAIDISNLTQLNLCSNQLSGIDLNNNINLAHLDLRSNQLSAIDVSTNINLTQLYLSYNKLFAIDVSNNISLSHLDLSSNNIPAIDISNNINLTQLQLQYNKLFAIDVSSNINLTVLGLSSNTLSAINLSHNINLDVLRLQQNKLSAIDVSNNINLTQLYLQSNRLSAIDVSNNINLTELYLRSNQLSAIDLSNCTKLTWLTLSDNSLKSVLLSFSWLIQYSDFSHQRSAACKVQLLCNEEDSQRCNELAKEQTEKYRKGSWRNKHGGNYAFVCIKSK